MAEVTFSVAQETDTARWNAYVAAHPQGRFEHRLEWRAVCEAGMGQASPFLMAQKAGVICGILPLTFRKSFLFGRAAISGFVNLFGGALADTRQIAKSLYEEAQRMSVGAGCPFLEVRLRPEDDELDIKGWSLENMPAAVFTRPLAATAEEQLLTIPRKQRAVVRKSLQNNLEIARGAHMLTQAHRLYARSVHRLGTPVFPKKLFEALAHYLPENTEFAVVTTPEGAGGKYGQKAVASLVTFYDETRVMPFYAGSLPQARRLGAHDFLYYQTMCTGIEKGCSLFDFGRSKIGSGPYQFKKNWGFEGQKLKRLACYQPEHDMPDLSPQNPKYARFSRVWSSLPAVVVDRVGPYIAKGLG